MQIQQNYATYNSRITPRKSQSKIASLPCDSVNFSGHANIENCTKSGFGLLIHQTALGRDLKTKLFVRDYIYDNFLGKNKINIISGGCSTGEETATYGMLLNPLGDKIAILGIDLGKTAIKSAKSGKFTFEIPTDKNKIIEEFKSIDASPYSDYYLFTTSNSGLSADQNYFKSLFKEFFEPTNRKIRTPFFEWLHNSMEKRNGLNPLIVTRKEYKLNDSIQNRCKFIEGDIRDIDKLTNGEKAEIISFNNALYHLTTQCSDDGGRLKHWNRDEIAEDLMTKFRDCLVDKGLVVFGENEEVQLLDNEMVPKIMKKLDFKPLNKTDSHEANVWQKP